MRTAFTGTTTSDSDVTADDRMLADLATEADSAERVLAFYRDFARAEPAGWTDPRRRPPVASSTVCVSKS